LHGRHTVSLVLEAAGRTGDALSAPDRRESGKPSGQRGDDLLHLLDHQRRGVDLAIGGFAIRARQLVLEPESLGSGVDDCDVIVLGLVEETRVLGGPAFEGVVRRLPQDSAVLDEEDEQFCPILAKFGREVAGPRPWHGPQSASKTGQLAGVVS
jgi:hypothetical protein